MDSTPRVGSFIARKYWTRVEVTDSDEQFCLDIREHLDCSLPSLALSYIYIYYVSFFLHFFLFSFCLYVSLCLSLPPLWLYLIFLFFLYHPFLSVPLFSLLLCLWILSSFFSLLFSHTVERLSMCHSKGRILQIFDKLVKHLIIKV